PQHDVVRLQVAVEHPPRMGVVDRLADRHERAEQAAQFERARPRTGMPGLVETADRLPQALPAHQAHGVVGPAVALLAEAVDRYDAGVFEVARHLRLEHEPGPADRVLRAAAL